MGKLGTFEHTVEIDGKTITFEAGMLAQQAGGAVISAVGDTKVLTTTTAGPVKDFLPFFPLTIEVEERMYAAGRIPGSFFKREGRPSENAILTCRLTDRPLRPTFADGLRNEIQVVNTVLQTTQIDPYDVIAMNGSSLSTMLAGVPFDGPVAAVRYAMMRDGSWVAFPTFEELEEEGVFNMVVAGRVEDDGEVAILMIEAEATPDSFIKIEMGATAPTEEVVGQAIEDVKPILKQLCEAQTAFVEQVGRREGGEFPIFLDYTDEVFEALAGRAENGVSDIYHDAGTSKEQKNEALFSLRDQVVAQLAEEGVGDLSEEEVTKQAKNAFRSLEKKVVRKMIVDEGVRVDGRGPRDLRQVTSDVQVLPKTHGSAIFQRGETQVLSVLALGSTRENQRIDTLDPVEEKYYMHHYNMPPYSTGEAGRVGSPKRREIGHGLLAERAIVPVLPPMDEWPYTMRVVSDILSSNGSTSMGSVCGSTLALMDGGVPIHAPVSGIAMGLIFENGKYTTLTDIQGVEDFYGDMDFKVAGPEGFITALQLDTKLTGVPSDVLRDALLQAREARMSILEVMLEAIPEPRDEVAEGAPRVEVVHIPQDKIGEVIGPRGKIIKEITEETGANIDIEEEGGRGVVRIYANSAEVAQAAVDRVNAIANPTLPEVGERYNATVVKTVDFGAFVNLTPGIDGLLHISALSKMVGKRLDHGEEAVDVGDKVWVEVKDILDGGRKFKLEYVGDPSAPSSSDDAGDDDGDAGDDRGGDRGGRERGGDRGGRSRGGDRERGGDRDKGGDRERGGDRDKGGDRDTG
ncbi:MAG: polyribonucleotide nucleotidyltransferase, partial [Actinobacteria bacterium]|nr:polyribonucleotide nucleotidyltransferase [Actinomycetota bacterium]